MLTKLFRLRGELPPTYCTAIELAGFGVLLTLWSVFTGFHVLPPILLPAPWAVVTSLKELHFEDALIRNLGYSVKINLMGYAEAVAISVPLGFVIGLFPVFREMFRRPVDALRFLPLTLLLGLFIVWFGIETQMKVHFLAFGIVVYLLPVVIQRINEVDDVYVDTIFTLGATKWQTITKVFVPAVLSKLSDDIRVLVAISWTYIIFAEVINKSDGGIGALAFTCARQSRTDKVFAILLIIIGVGFLQDKLAVIADHILFPHKKVRGNHV